MPPLPTPDQAAAEKAAQAAATARQDLEAQLTAGTLTLEGLFQQSEAEPKGDSHRVVGHMHVKAALVALPNIGDTKADAILATLGMDHDKHIDALGTTEQSAIIAAVAAA